MLDKETFLADINVGPKTKLDYGRTMDLFERFLDGREPNEAEARAFLRDLAERGRKAATLARHGIAIRRYFKWARTPLDLDLPTVVREVPPWMFEWLSTPESRFKQKLERILEVSDTPLDTAMLMVLYDAPMRISELLALKKEDILWEEGFIRVRRAKKTRALPEFLPVSEKTLEALREYMDWARHRGDLIFPYTYNEVYWWLKKLAKKAGVDRLTPHMLRHGRAGDLRLDGAAREDIQDLLGHVKSDTTAIYDQILPAALKRKIPPGF